MVHYVYGVHYVYEVHHKHGVEYEFEVRQSKSKMTQQEQEQEEEDENVESITYGFAVGKKVGLEFGQSSIQRSRTLSHLAGASLSALATRRFLLS